MRFSKNAWQGVLGKVAVYAALALVAALCVLPFWHMVMSSLSDPLKLSAAKGFLWLPIADKNGDYSTLAYSIIGSYKPLWRSYLNTIIYTVSSTLLGLLILTMAAYVLSRRDCLLRKPLMIFFLITLFFNGGIIPYFIVVRSLGLANNMLALIIPGCANAFSLLLIKNGMDALPNEYYEAARIDGAGHFYCMLKIIVPLSGPFLGVTAMFSAIGQWNSWVPATYFIDSQHKQFYPLQLMLKEILAKTLQMGISAPTGGNPITYYQDGIKAASVVIASLPLLIIYPFIQKYFEKGIILGGVKG